MEKPNHYEEGKIKSMIIENIVRDPCSRVKLKERMSNIVGNKTIDYHLDRDGKGLKNWQTTRKGIKLAPILEEKNHRLSLIESRGSLISILYYMLENDKFIRDNFRNLLFSAYISPFGERRLLSSNPYYIRGDQDWTKLMSETRGEIDIELAVSYLLMMITNALNFERDNEVGKLKTYFSYSLALKSNEWIKEKSKKVDAQRIKSFIVDLIEFPIFIIKSQNIPGSLGIEEEGMPYFKNYVESEEIAKMATKLNEPTVDIDWDFEERFLLNYLLRENPDSGLFYLFYYGPIEKKHSLMWDMTSKLNTLLYGDIYESKKYLKEVPILSAEGRGNIW